MAADNLPVIATDMVQAPNDKQQIQPMLNGIDTLPNAGRSHRGPAEGGDEPRPPCVVQANPGTGVRIIKSVMGFRQFMLRGTDRVRDEWRLVTMAWNVKPMFMPCPEQ